MEPIYQGDVAVSLDSISYSWGRKGNTAYLYMAGRVYRSGIDCTFRLEINRKGHHLSFPRATTTNEGEDLRSLAFSVKTALLHFLKNSKEVPEAHRQRLCDCVLRHHLKKNNDDR